MILSTLSPATGPLLVATALLALAGTAKLHRPAPTGLALARLGLPGSDRTVRAIGAGEVIAAGAAAGASGWYALPVLGLYLAFAAVAAVQVGRARAGGEVADCGCFGDHAAPVEGTHVAVNLLAAAAAAWAVAAPAPGLVAAASDAPGTTAVLALLAVVGAVGVRAVLTDLALVRALVRLDTDR